MILQNVDTIAAISTAQGRGGIGVVRISGPLSELLALGILGKLPEVRHATLANFFDKNGDTLDQGVAIFFSGPHSYTGEDVLELQGHGGNVVQQLLLQRCLDLGARLAQPGEFTLRAFLNNKFDLAQAESVSDLIDANSAEAARCAVRSMCGEFSASIHSLVKDLIHLRILVEAMLDFPEEDIEVIDTAQRDILLERIQRCLHQTLDSAKQGSLLREGAYIAIAGQTNVGKSSLLNRLAGEEIALVSDIPGTTRDVIRQAIQIRGVPLHVLDTAGLRESQDIVEIMGIQRAYQTFNSADLILYLLDASKGITIQDQDILDELPSEIPRMLVFNKSDLLDKEFIVSGVLSHHFISAKSGAGIDKLRDNLLEAIGWRDQDCGAFMARERHIRALKLAQLHLNQSMTLIYKPELFAEELRLTQASLNQITGEYTSDDLLGEIFSRFCIGK